MAPLLMVEMTICCCYCHHLGKGGGRGSIQREDCDSGGCSDEGGRDQLIVERKWCGWISLSLAALRPMMRLQVGSRCCLFLLCSFIESFLIAAAHYNQNVCLIFVV